MSLAYYRWAIARAMEHCGSSMDGGARARCEQIADALIEWKPEALALLRDELVRKSLDRASLDPMSQDALGVAWGCLALFTGYRQDTGYIDPALVTMAGAVAYWKAEALVGVTLSPYMAAKAKATELPRMAAARDQAQAAERDLCARMRRELGAEPYEMWEPHRPARRQQS